MRKRRIYFGLLLLAVGIAITLSQIRREPEYAGETLSEWVEGFVLDDGRHTRQQRLIAINAMGTDVVPFLLQWMRYETPVWKEKIFESSNKLLGWPRDDWWENDKNVIRMRAAAEAFHAAGGRMNVDWRGMLKEPSPTIKAAAVDGLVRLGKEGLPPLLEGLTNEPLGLRIYIIQEIPLMGAFARPAVPILRALLTDTNREIRSAATNALHFIDL